MQAAINTSIAMIIVLASVIVMLVHFFLTNLSTTNGRAIVHPSVALGISFGCGIAVLMWRLAL